MREDVMRHVMTTVLNHNICAFNHQYFDRHLVFLICEKREKNIGRH